VGHVTKDVLGIAHDLVITLSLDMDDETDSTSVFFFFGIVETLLSRERRVGRMRVIQDGVHTDVATVVVDGLIRAVRARPSVLEHRRGEGDHPALSSNVDIYRRGDQARSMRVCFVDAVGRARRDRTEEQLPSTTFVK
jgi:hypothetical protein